MVKGWHFEIIDHSWSKNGRMAFKSTGQSSFSHIFPMNCNQIWVWAIFSPHLIPQPSHFLLKNDTEIPLQSCCSQEAPSYKEGEAVEYRSRLDVASALDRRLDNIGRTSSNSQTLGLERYHPLNYGFAETWIYQRLEHVQTEVSWNRGTPKSSILIGFSFINHPAIGGPPFQDTPKSVLTVRFGPFSTCSAVSRSASAGWIPAKAAGTRDNGKTMAVCQDPWGNERNSWKTTV